MLKLGVIKPVTEATSGISSFVIVKSKKDTPKQKTNDPHPKSKLWVCIDPSNLNKATTWEPYYYCTIEDVIPELSNARYFTIIDMKWGYWQIPLDEESSFLTTFNSHMDGSDSQECPFGLNVAGDAFQWKLDQVYSNLKGVARIADDMFIYGTSDDDHDQNQTNSLNRTREHGLKIGVEKIQYKKTSVGFCGSQFTAQGHKPTDKKIQDIQLMPKPKDIKQLQSFLGMINYLNWYSPRLAEITSPLRDLTKDNVPFIWGPEHTNAFHAEKQEIAKAPLMAYYDPKKPTAVQTDASGYGIGCALLQTGKPVAYASKALQAHEQGYVALEREALAVAWALEKHHHFLYGQCFTLETDQKCLENILNRSIVESCHRL